MKLGDIFAGLLCFLFVAGIIWICVQPHQTYIGTYCNPQNECRYHVLDYKCPPTDRGEIIIGEVGVLKECKEQK